MDMATPPIHSSAFEQPQPIRADLIAYRNDEITAHAEAIRVMVGDLLPDGVCITPTAAQGIGRSLEAMRRELVAITEAMHLKVTTLDCLAAIARVLPAAGMTEATLYRRLARLDFRAADIRPAVLALIENGKLLRTPDARSTTKGPTPHRLVWRKPKD